MSKPIRHRAIKASRVIGGRKARRKAVRRERRVAKGMKAARRAESSLIDTYRSIGKWPPPKYRPIVEVVPVIVEEEKENEIIIR